MWFANLRLCDYIAPRTWKSFGDGAEYLGGFYGLRGRLTPGPSPNGLSPNGLLRTVSQRTVIGGAEVRGDLPLLDSGLRCRPCGLGGGLYWPHGSGSFGNPQVQASRSKYIRKPDLHFVLELSGW